MRVYLLVMLVAAASTYVAVPVIRHVALVSNALTPVRARDVHVTPIPRLGGVAMFLGLFTAIAVASRMPYLATVVHDGGAWAVVLGAGLVCALGVVDDLWDLDWMTKLVGQVLAAGTLYGALTSLCEKGWIRPLPAESGSRKKEYQLTAEGVQVLKHELARLQQLVANGESILKEEAL